MQADFPDVKPPDESPRPVSRGVNLHLAFLGIDSLYLVLEYPHRDVFDFWSDEVRNVSEKQLYTGVTVDDFVIRRGAHGYKFSIWDGDARLFVTDRVENALRDTPAAGEGMGVMLQLGPRWLQQYGNFLAPDRLRSNIFAQLSLFGVRDSEHYPARLNRMDIALDVLGLRVADFCLDEWRKGWVGRAHRKHFYDSSQAGQLEGFAIGSSKGAIRFKIYNKVTQSISIGQAGFWRAVWNVGENDPHDVARFEWSIKPYQARFAGMRYLADYTFRGFLDLLNYASFQWGRLCVPSDDENRSRWELSPLWAGLQQLVKEWSLDYEGMAKRSYDVTPDISPAYLRSVAGWLGGLQARLGVSGNMGQPASISEALSLLEKSGYAIDQKAQEKYAVLVRLAGKLNAHE